MDAQMRQAYLSDHVPYRMRNVDALRWACGILQGAPSHRVQVLIDGKLRLDGGFRFFTNPLVEAGIVSGRVLLEFMGIKLGSKTRVLSNTLDMKSDDVTLASFELDPLEPSAIEKHGADAAESCIRVVELANKAVAHLTSQPRQRDDLRKLKRAAELIPILVCESLYDPLRHARPDFRWGSGS